MKENFGGGFEKSYDLIVVGTGAGGATVAREMSKRGKKVLMLEQGPHREPDGSILSTMKDEQTYVTPQMCGVVRAKCTGGSTLYYYGSAIYPPIDRYKPFGLDLKEDADEMYRDLYFLGPLKEHMISNMSKAIMESACSLGHNWAPIDKFIIQDRWTPDYEFSVSDPRDVKWSALMYVREAMLNGAKLLNHAKVTRVLLENKKAVGVEFKQKGVTHKVNASKVVLAGGGMSTPLFLRDLGVKGVGRDYFVDPFVDVVGEHRTLSRDREIPMSCGCNFTDDGYFMTDLQIPSRVQESMLASQVGRFDQMFKQKHTMGIMIKLKDSLGGTLGKNGWPLKNLSLEDRKRLKEGAAKAKKILQKLGCKSMYTTYYLAAHPGGTVKIGEFLDSNLKTQFDNLYVCDSSVIPVPCGLPPVTQIITLGKYLSRHLAGVNNN
jgi:choline dehydrogenase-like flavoprotein